MTPDEPPMITRRRTRGALPGMPGPTHAEPGPTHAQRASPQTDGDDHATGPTKRAPVSKRAKATTTTEEPRRSPAPPPTAPADEREDADRTLVPRATLTRAGAGVGYMITVRLPEPLHQRYRRLVRALATENTPASVTAIVHFLLADAPLSTADMRALVRRWRAVLDVAADEAPSHPYLGTGNHATTLRVDAQLRDRAIRVIDELDEQRFRTSLNEVLQALMHFGPHNAADAKRLLESPREPEPTPKRPTTPSTAQDARAPT